MKKSIAPFKMLPVELRDHLHELTGNELKVWMCIVLHSDGNRESFPSNRVIMAETKLSHTTVAKAKQGLRAKCWLTSAQRYRENGSLSSMGEKWHLPKHQGDISLKSAGIPTKDSAIPSPQLLGEPEVDTLEENTGKPDTSKPQDQNLLVSKEVSEASLARLATPFAQEKREPLDPLGALPEQTKPSDDLWSCESEAAWLAQERIPYWSDPLGRGLDINEVVTAEELYLDLIPTGNMHEADVVTLAEIALAYQTDHQHGQAIIRQVWYWNHLHKKESLRFRTIQGLAKAVRSESDNNIVIQWNEHNTLDCPKCKKLRKCVQCGLLDDGTGIDPGRDYPDTYLHKGCYWSWVYGEPTYQDKMRQPANVCCAMSYNSDGAGHVPTCPNYKKPASSFGGTENGSCMKCMSQGITICECDGCWEADGPNPDHSAMSETDVF
jgi:hypothetical protein